MKRALEEHPSLLVIRTVDDFVWLLATDYRLTAQRVADGTPVPKVRPACPPRVAEVYGAPKPTVITIAATTPAKTMPATVNQLGR